MQNCFFQVREIDYNFDGIADELFFQITIKASPNTNVVALTLTIMLDYKLQVNNFILIVTILCC